MLALIAALVAAPAVGVGPATPQSDPPVRITLNGSDYAVGDRVKVQVQARDDGYLVVFRVDVSGRVRVLFPIDPDVDAFVRGGKHYELRGRADRETFLADDRGGNGLIYAALSAEPMSFGAFAAGDHWDYSALRMSDSAGDDEADLTRIVRRMTDNGRFDYDVVGYRVRDGVIVADVPGLDPIGYYGSTGYYGAGGYGGYYDPFYDPYWDCFTCYRSGLRISVGLGSAYRRYDPFFCGGWYCDRFGYGYGGYYPGYYYPGQFYPYSVVNYRPRPPIPNTPYGVRSRPQAFGPTLSRPTVVSRGVGGGIGVPNRPVDDNYDGRTRARPAPVTREREQPRRDDNPPSRRSDNPQPRVSEPSTPRVVAAPGGGDYDGRSRRRPESFTRDARPAMQGSSVPSQAIDRRRDDDRPVFREPSRPEPRTEQPQRVERPREDRPVYREPTRVERQPERRESPPPAARSAPPPQRSEPPRSEPQRSSGSSGSTHSGRSRP